MQATTINKAQYSKAASIVNKVLRQYSQGSFKPSVSVVDRGTDGYIILMNDDAFDIAAKAFAVEEIFYAGEAIVIGDDDFYLEAFDSRMAFKLAYR